MPLGTLEDWAKGDLNKEVFTEPSMVEPVHNLSLEEIMRDYRLGITHSFRTPMYDKGEDVEDVDIPEDITDIMVDDHPFAFSPEPSRNDDQDLNRPLDNKSSEASDGSESPTAN